MIYINTNDPKPIWGWASKLEHKGKVIIGTLSTSEKDQEGNYVKSYWNAMFVGGEVEEGKISITKAKIYKKKVNDKEYTNITVYEWDQNHNTPKFKSEDENQTPESMGFMALEDDDPF